MLFEPDRPRDTRLMDGLDAINNRLGKKTLVLAREGFAGEWPARRSPLARYTTRINGIAPCADVSIKADSPTD